MIKEFLVSFKENLETKSSNPFFGTLILIWFLKNWELFYTLFNFDSKTSLSTKKDFIFNHFKKMPFIENILICILKAFIVLLISYCLINISRLIINFFEKKITPLMYMWTDKTSIVLKSVYEISEEERKRLEKRVDEERSSRIKLQDDYDKLEQKFADFILKQQEPQTKSTDNKITVTENLEPKSVSEKNMSDLIHAKLVKDNLLESFENVAQDILNKQHLDKNRPEIKKFVSLGLITRGNLYSGAYYLFGLTPLGKIMNEKILYENLK